MPLIGVDRETGQALSGWPRVQQSVQAIVATEIGSYLGMRHFGSYVPALIDEPLSDFWIAMHFTAIVTAISRFEPEFVIDEISLDTNINSAQKGILKFNLEGFYKAIDSENIERKTAAIEVNI